MVPKNQKHARNWLSKAAQQGHKNGDEGVEGAKKSHLTIMSCCF